MYVITNSANQFFTAYQNINVAIADLLMRLGPQYEPINISFDTSPGGWKVIMQNRDNCTSQETYYIREATIYRAEDIKIP